jgi:hypothetical protein
MGLEAGGAVTSAAAAGPALTGLAVAAAGVGGYSLGRLIGSNGGDELMQAGFDVLLAQNNRQRQATVNGLIAQAQAHLVKVAKAGGPDQDPDFEHHKKEIKAFLERAKARAQRLPTQMRERLVREIDRIAKKVELEV